MAQPASPHHPGKQQGPGAPDFTGPHRKGNSPEKAPAKPKTAVLAVKRADDGEATYQLLIDGEAQKRRLHA